MPKMAPCSLSASFVVSDILLMVCAKLDDTDDSNSRRAKKVKGKSMSFKPA